MRETIRTPRERRLDRTRLLSLAEWLDDQAALLRNRSGDIYAEARAGQLLDEAGAIRREIKENDALRFKLDPTNEGPQQLVRYLTGGDG